MEKRLQPEISRQIVDSLGGTKYIAEVFACSMSVVSRWKRYGIPRGYVSYLREKFKANEYLKSDEVKTFLRPNR